MNRDERSIENSAKWGEFGWAMPPFLPFDFCSYPPPPKREEADRMIMNECTEENLAKAWRDIRNSEYCDVEDWDEAVLDYKNHCYKSCALLLYSMIEHLLISAQKNIAPDEKCLLGKDAFPKLEQYWQGKKQLGNQDINSVFDNNFSRYFSLNINACLKLFFKGGNNFTLDGSFPYRNMLLHGMFSRKTEPKDCIQLFFLYWPVATTVCKQNKKISK